MGDNKKLNLQRYKKSAKGVMEFARLIETASPDLRERMIEQAREEDPTFLDTVLAQVRKLEAFNAKQELKLDRFKKSQTGIVEFARLLEQSTPSVRETILKRAKEQDSQFVVSVLRKTVFLKSLYFWMKASLRKFCPTHHRKYSHTPCMAWERSSAKSSWQM